MSKLDIFDCKIDKVAIDKENKKMVFGDKAKKLSGNKNAVILDILNPQIKAEADIGSPIVLICGDLSEKYSRGTSLVIDFEGNKTLYDREGTEKLLAGLSGDEGIMFKIVNTLMDKQKEEIRNDPKLKEVVNFDNPEVKIFSEDLQKRVEGTSRKSDMILPENKEEPKKKVKRTTKRNNGL
tara:strand:+ start:8353 stop:8895 length:543 start_codon:yes stop_codon:yes gene_type:complete